MQSFKLCKLLLWEGLYNIKTMKSYKARNSFHFASSTLVIEEQPSPTFREKIRKEVFDPFLSELDYVTMASQAPLIIK